MRPYERFEAWRLCRGWGLANYNLTRAFPLDERFGLASQARRAAFSAAANIVEGCVKKGPREFGRFLDISIGSLGEIGYIIQLATDLQYVSPEDAGKAISLHTQASKATWALYKSMRR